MDILGHVDYEGKAYAYVDKDTNGYEIITSEFMGETKWVDGRKCIEIIIPQKEESLFTPQNEFEKLVVNVCMELAETLIKKNRDYGDSFKILYDEYGDFSTEHRLTDKLNRFKTLNKQRNLIKDESKEDTLLDIAGYSVLTLATKRGE